MKKLQLNPDAQQGFIPMMIILIIIVLGIVFLAYLRVRSLQ
ncbi:MAG: hypothetical protein ABIQ89_04225 [Candidatus Saccharimonadales bacterium]